MARALLLKNEWNTGLAIKRFAEDYDYVSRTFGFEIGATQVPKDASTEFCCLVCYCEYPLSEFVHMPDCGHGLCEECYAEYLTSKVTDGNESVLTTCPES